MESLVLLAFILLISMGRAFAGDVLGAPCGNRNSSWRLAAGLNDELEVEIAADATEVRSELEKEVVRGVADPVSEAAGGIAASQWHSWLDDFCLFGLGWV